ncbi:flagellar assembly protein FliW [Neobacillus sp. SM06]|uniref:flagellar assembly protein FliW n=1 Tax=Neobacillus sp. SM06 TaxID=3422492 RepID=UPI003D28D012
MKIYTKYHGEIEIEEKNIVHFPQGIPGFIEDKEFVLLPFSEDGIFKILQSIKETQIAFVVTNPFAFFKEYDFVLDDQTIQVLELTSEQDVDLYIILTLNEKIEKTTANLQAPVVINKKINRGKQVVLTNSNYTTKHFVFSHHTMEVN